MNVLVKPERDGSARVKLPEDERSVFVQGLPFGYTVQSITYGGRDIQTEPLKLGGSETRDLEVKLLLDPNVPTGNLRGRVSGLDPQSRAQLVLHGVAFVSSFEMPVGGDGSFSFSKLPQGTYTPTLTGDVPPGRITPAAILVTDKDLAGIELTAPRRTARTEPPRTDDRPTGARVSELGSVPGEAASESAALSGLRTINTAQVTYLVSTGGNYGSLQDLIDAGLIDESFLKVRDGYAFSILARGGEYAAVAVPTGNGRSPGYFSLPDAVVRYPLAGPLAPAGAAGQPVR